MSERMCMGNVRETLLYVRTDVCAIVIHSLHCLVHLLLTTRSLRIPAQLLNFWIIPLRWQMLYVNCVALLWNTYLSYAAHKVLEIDVDSSMEDGKK
jgi:hypothetical protein